MSNTFPALDGSAPKQQKFAQAPEMGIDPAKRYTAAIETTLGTLVIALDAIAAPKTVNNFVFLAAQHYYDGVIFHRIISGFMCQGGDPDGIKSVLWRWLTRARTPTARSSSLSAARLAVACHPRIHCLAKSLRVSK